MKVVLVGRISGIILDLNTVGSGISSWYYWKEISWEPSHNIS